VWYNYALDEWVDVIHWLSSSHFFTSATKTIANVDKSSGSVRLYADDLCILVNFTFPRLPSHLHSPINMVAVKFLKNSTAPIFDLLNLIIAPSVPTAS